MKFILSLLPGRGELNPWHYIHYVSYIVFPLYFLYWCATHFTVTDLLAMYFAVVLTGINISMFVHRCWSHRSWKPARWLNITALFLYTIQFCGAHGNWVAVHRKHHRLEDTPEDPHSPYYMARWKVIFCPVIIPDRKYIGDLLRDPDHQFFFRYYWHINIAWWLLLFAINPIWLSFWVALIGISGFKMRLINSIGHADPINKSTNNRPIYAFFYMDGEPWHDNHSRNPNNWQLGVKWYEIDVSKYLIWIFTKFGWAKINRVN